jgi:hypothetical protein
MTESDDKKRAGEFVMKESTDKKPSMPGIDFSTFIISLNSSALVNLGKLPVPGTKDYVVNRAAAKQTIDMVAMLEAKTKGNLTKDEENLLKNILHDLRLMFINKKK